MQSAARKSSSLKESIKEEAETNWKRGKGGGHWKLNGRGKEKLIATCGQEKQKPQDDLPNGQLSWKGGKIEKIGGGGVTIRRED